MLTAAGLPVRRAAKSVRRVVFTLHLGDNNVFAAPPSGELTTQVIAFKRFEDAKLLGLMLEAHRETEFEWPTLDESFRLVLPSPLTKDLRMVDIFPWKQSELDEHCVANCLDILLISAFECSSDTIIVCSDARKLSLSDVGFYRDRFDSLLNV